MCKFKKILLFVLLCLVVPIIRCNASDLKIMPVSAIDGDSTLLKSGEEYLLVDVGCYETKEKVEQILEKNGITKNTPFSIYISHYHGDHYGSYCYSTTEGYDSNKSMLKELLENYTISNLYLPNKPYITAENEKMKKSIDYIDELYSNFTSLANERRTNVITLEQGSTFKFGNTSAKVLFLERACDDYVYNEAGQINPQPEGDCVNNSSLVTMFTNGNTKFLTAGDIESHVEKKIISEGVDIKADIFKLSHHSFNWIQGQYYNISNTADFINKIQPKYVYFQTRYLYTNNVYSRYEKSYEELRKFSNIYADIDLKGFEKGNRYPNGEIWLEINDDKITTFMENNSYKITINYVDKDTNEVLDSKTSYYSLSENYYLYDYEKDIKGYSFYASDVVQTGTLTTNLTYNVSYTKNNYILTIRHVNEKGESIVEDQKITYEYKDEYETSKNSGILEKYDLVEEPANFKGTIEGDTTVTYIYKKKNFIEVIVPNTSSRIVISIFGILISLVGCVLIIYTKYFKKC